MKSAKPTMDSMLRFIDSERTRVATFLTGQTPEWFAACVGDQKARVKRRYETVAERVRELAAYYGDSQLEAKAERVATALCETAVPACEFTELGAEGSGRWHVDVSVDVDSRRRGEQRTVRLGCADYGLTVRRTHVDVDTTRFDEQLKLPTSFVVRFTDANPNPAQLANSALAEFVKWLRDVDPEACRSESGKRWRVHRAEDTESIYFFCVPRITSLSACIKRLRKFESALPEGRVFVCLADPEEAPTLEQQGFGTLLFPSGVLYGWPIETETEPEPEADSILRSSWGKLWVSEGRLDIQAFY